MVLFDEPSHSYTTKKGRQYISATTLIGRYKPPFDADYWSTYKGIERTITEVLNFSGWVKFKKADGGFKTVIERFFRSESEGGASDEEKEMATTAKKAVLEEWDYERNVACRNGTAFHKSKEKEWLDEEKHEVLGKTMDIGKAFSSQGTPIELDLLKDGVYSEITLWNNFYEVAGQADIAIVETIDGIRYVDIDDYKTNKKISTESYQNPRTKQRDMMFRPLGSLMDCNFQHYELQMSLYAYMFECYGYVVRSLNFRHYNNEGTKESPKFEFNRNFPLTYRKKEIVKMLNHYDKNK
jgi:hypothetical protein